MRDSTDLHSWFRERLSHFLGFPVGEELINYILTHEHACDVKEHLSSLLDVNDTETRSFVDEFFKRWSPPSNSIHDAKSNKKSGLKTNLSKQKIPVFMGELGDDRYEKPLAKMGVHRNLRRPQETEKKDISPFKSNHLPMNFYFRNDEKLKEDLVMLPGRHACQCLAQKHQLINNCIECGRIVCEQEGSGPCMFCGNLVCSSKDMEMINRDSKKGNKLKEKLLAQIVPNCVNSLQKAIAHKEQLLHFDRNPTERRKVIDVDADYFSIDDRWLNRKRKGALARWEEGLSEKRLSRSDRKFGRENVKEYPRLQDKEIQEMADQGICFSVHQPWASLLVHGIRKVERCSWYTSHRGRLWIASTLKVPGKEFVSQIESQCRNMFQDREIKFPTTYPTGVLLGCANLIDCAAHEDDTDKDTNFEEESSSQYLLYFNNPEQLSLKLPVNKGKRKTYKLDGHIHTAAKDMLIMT